MSNIKQHWNDIFDNTQTEDLGWFDAENSQIKDFISRGCWLREDAKIFFAGAGTSSLVKDLSAQKRQLVINDISSIALERLKIELKASKSSCHWICQDVSRPISEQFGNLDLWIDRAVLHFLHDESDIQGYFDNLTGLLKPGGYALFAEFSKQGAAKCAGLPINRYDLAMLQQRLPEFSLVEHDEFLFTSRTGLERPYIIALFQKPA
ncbi:MAG: class I SAM-dependent methyltransferase [Enterobacterales bacterium]|nr:class I SAM-dependent methyltransferase [Enterobacterales bacterium]